MRGPVSKTKHPEVEIHTYMHTYIPHTHMGKYTKKKTSKTEGLACTRLWVQSSVTDWEKGRGKMNATYLDTDHHFRSVGELTGLWTHIKL